VTPLRLEPTVPADRGEPMSADDICREYLKNKVSRRTVTARMPKTKRFYLGGKLHMWRRDVEDALPLLVGAA
jgi:hypothetical protein